MFKHSFNKFFPIPNFISTPSFGIDISDNSLKFVELTMTKDGIRLGRYGEQKIPEGVIKYGKILNKDIMKEILLTFKKSYGIKNARISILENQIYLFKLSLEKSELSNINEAIELSLEEHIPLPAGETIFDYELLNENKDTIELEVVAVSKNIVQSYFSLFKESGIEIVSIEMEAQAIGRSVVKNGDMDTYMVVDFREKNTCIFIISKGIIMFSSTLEIGGAILNSMIQKNFQISGEEADKMKKEFGLERNSVNKEIFPVLLNSVSILRDELVKYLDYWNTHKDEDEKNNPPIKKIIISGEDSNLKGLVDYLFLSMKIKVELADIWINIIDTEKNIPDMNFKQSLSFAVAMGLALGNFKDN